MRGKTLAHNCGERWPRMLSPTLAAAYCGMLLPEFSRTDFYTLACCIDGKPWFDRVKLDAAIGAKMSGETAAAK